MTDDMTTTSDDTHLPPSDDGTDAYDRVAVASLDIPRALADLLGDYGFRTAGDIRKAGRERLMAIQGFGKRKYAVLARAILDHDAEPGSPIPRHLVDPHGGLPNGVGSRPLGETASIGRKAGLRNPRQNGTAKEAKDSHRDSQGRRSCCGRKRCWRCRAGLVPGRRHQDAREACRP